MGIINNQQSKSSFKSELLKLCYPLNVVIKEETASTNSDAKLLGEKGEKDTLIIAFKQTDGKGRLGKSFFSPESTGIYMSLLLHPQLKAEESLFLTTSAAVAVAQAAEKFSGKETFIKWVNDIYVNGKKVCGILSSAAFRQSARPDYVIIGIGINLNTPKGDFPKEIKDIAASLFEEKEVTNELKAQLISDIVNKIIYFLNGDDLRSHLKEYKKKSFLNEKTVCYEKGGQQHTAVVKGIDDDCHLILEKPDGSFETLFAGEVSVRCAKP